MVLKLDPKKNKVGFIYPGNEYGKSLLKLVEDGFDKRTDAKLVSSVEVSDRAQDYIQPVLKLKASAPDVVMAVGYFRNGVLLSKALDQRSEEHTSELPSLMSISYALFCLKKKI